MVINWYDNEESAEATGWLDDQPDVIGEFQSEQGPAEAGMSKTAGSVEKLNTSPESAGVESFAREWSILSTGISEQSTALTQSEQERFEDSERIRKAKGHVGVETAASTEMEDAVSIGIKGTVSICLVLAQLSRYSQYLLSLCSQHSPFPYLWRFRPPRGLLLS